MEIDHDDLAAGHGSKTETDYSDQALDAGFESAARVIRDQRENNLLPVCTRLVYSQECAARSLTFVPLPLVSVPKVVRTPGAGADVGFESAARVNSCQNRLVLLPSVQD